MNWLRLLAIGLFVLLYLRSPIDLLPDRIGLPGILDDLILLLGFLWWARRQFSAQLRPKSAPQQPRQCHAEPWDPYEVLGVSRDASPEEVTHAYREQMKQYHPDRVAGLGKELQEVAHRKAIEIQRAYAELGKT